ncbi:hypothetical protein [Halobacillus karajensis]|nr:hypothetical protein [Halobacillus karajensis]CDQ17965.1 hypothetical protein BN982_00205 [Halobacillus karajensis]
MQKGDLMKIEAMVKKVKKGVPTVLEIEGKRYVYEPKNSQKSQSNSGRR